MRVFGHSLTPGALPAMVMDRPVSADTAAKSRRSAAAMKSA